MTSFLDGVIVNLKEDKMNTRIKELREHFQLTMEKFGNRLGVKKNTVSQWESGTNSLTDQTITSICREFNVNEDWLRNGTGDMFLPTSRRKEIEKLTNQLLAEEEDSFKNRFIAMLADFSVKEWEFLETRLSQLFEGNYQNHEETSPPLTATKEDSAPTTVEEAEEEYIKNRLTLAKKTERSASSITKESGRENSLNKASNQ